MTIINSDMVKCLLGICRQRRQYDCYETAKPFRPFSSTNSARAGTGDRRPT